jgi:hypothetical protein
MPLTAEAIGAIGRALSNHNGLEGTFSEDLQGGCPLLEVVVS